MSASFCFGHSLDADLWMNLAISMMAVLVGMLVYIEMALAVKSFAVS